MRRQPNQIHLLPFLLSSASPQRAAVLLRCPSRKDCVALVLSVPGWEVLESTEQSCYITYHISDTSPAPSFLVGSCLQTMCVHRILAPCDNGAQSGPPWWECWRMAAPAVCLVIRDACSLTPKLHTSQEN